MKLTKITHTITVEEISVLLDGGSIVIPLICDGQFTIGKLKVCLEPLTVDEVDEFISQKYQEIQEAEIAS